MSVQLNALKDEGVNSEDQHERYTYTQTALRCGGEKFFPGGDELSNVMAKIEDLYYREISSGGEGPLQRRMVPSAEDVNVCDFGRQWRENGGTPWSSIPLCRRKKEEDVI